MRVVTAGAQDEAIESARTARLNWLNPSARAATHAPERQMQAGASGAKSVAILGLIGANAHRAAHCGKSFGQLAGFE